MDVFPVVRKFNSAATLLWRRSNFAVVAAPMIAVDSSNNLYLGGFASGGEGIAVMRIRSDAVTLWTRSFNGTGMESLYGLACDNAGNVILSGGTTGILAGNTDYAPNAHDAFVRVYKPNAEVKWTRQFGTPSYTSAWGGVTDSAGNLYVTGIARGQPASQPAVGEYDVFIRKMVI